MTSAVVLAEATKTDVDSAPVSEAAKSRLRDAGITHLTPVQERTLRAIIVDRLDVLVQAPTGSGKTLAYLLPLAHALEAAETARGGECDEARFRGAGFPSAIVFLPTRELAAQVFEHAEKHVTAGGFPCVLCCGGADEKPQISGIKNGARVVIGTPGRIKALRDGGVFKTDGVVFQVLDECDRLLDGGFERDVEEVCRPPGGKTRTACFSATMPPGLVRFLSKRLPPDRATVTLRNARGGNVGGGVEHLAFVVPADGKQSAVVDAVDAYADGASSFASGEESPRRVTGQTIVFVETKAHAERLAGTLAAAYEERSECSRKDETSRNGDDDDDDDEKNNRERKRRRRRVVSLHGDLPQTARDAAVASLRAGACDVLVATDVAARGLDLPGVELVVHADPPKDADAYAHRAGRAGRPGCAAAGVSLLLHEPGTAATAATAALEFRAKIRLRRLSAIGERAVTERSVAAARAAWEEKQRARSSSAGSAGEGGRVVDAEAARGGNGGGVGALGSRQSHKKTADPADETSFARLGERSLMDDRFDELSVDLASIRGKQKGKGRGRGKR